MAPQMRKFTCPVCGAEVVARGQSACHPCPQRRKNGRPQMVEMEVGDE